MTERRLIINADGYGFTLGVNRGIEEAIEAGVVTSISVNANFDSVMALARLIARHPEISVGVHLNPIVGRPLAPPRDVPTLVDARGNFHYESFVTRLRRGQIDQGELALELALQIERVQELVPAVTHIDSHQNAHLWPRFFDVFLELGAKYEIRCIRTDARWICVEHEHRLLRSGAVYLRNPRRLVKQVYARRLMRRARRTGFRMPDRTLRIGACGEATKPMLDAWLQVARTCPAGTSAAHCHPGYVDDDLRRWAKVIVEQREEERCALTDARLRAAFREGGVRLVSFAEL